MFDPIAMMNRKTNVKNQFKEIKKKEFPEIIKKNPIKGTKQHTCSICKKSFSKPSFLTRHGLVHTKEKPFKCLQCGKAFGQSSTLQLHEKTHLDARDYTCDICGFK